MTEREAAIVTAYTGFLVGEFSSFHKYAEELMKRPIQVIEFASEEMFRELKKKSHNDFTSIGVKMIKPESFFMEIDMENSAFADGNHVDELREIFMKIADKLDSGITTGYAFDTNGNKVGRFDMEYNEDEEEN